jgi:hypothetical protein
MEEGPSEQKVGIEALIVELLTYNGMGWGSTLRAASNHQPDGPPPKIVQAYPYASLHTNQYSKLPEKLLSHVTLAFGMARGYF